MRAPVTGSDENKCCKENIFSLPLPHPTVGLSFVNRTSYNGLTRFVRIVSCQWFNTNFGGSQEEKFMRHLAWNEYSRKVLAGDLLSREEAPQVLSANPSDTPGPVAAAHS